MNYALWTDCGELCGSPNCECDGAGNCTASTLNTIIDFNSSYDGEIKLGIKCKKNVSGEANIRIYEESYGTELIENIDCLAQSNYKTISASGFEKGKIYQFTLTIPEPCSTCTKTIYIAITEQEKTTSIPEMPLHLVVLIASIALIAVFLERKKN